MRPERGMLIVLSGPSGSGKGTLVKKAAVSERGYRFVGIGDHPGPAWGGGGVQYYFRTREQVEAMIAEGSLLEYAEYNGSYYGTPEPPIRQWLEKRQKCSVGNRGTGAEKVMDHRSDLVSLFITVPSMKELERRLRGRGTETEDSIRGRMQVARQELSRAFRYDYVVLNDEVDRAVQRIQTIIEAEKMRYSHMEDLIMEVMNDAEAQ